VHYNYEVIKMSKQNTNPEILTEKQFTEFIIKKGKERDLKRAKIEVKNNGVNNIKANTPLFKEVMQQMGVDYV